MGRGGHGLQGATEGNERLQGPQGPRGIIRVLRDHERMQKAMRGCVGLQVATEGTVMRSGFYDISRFYWCNLLTSFDKISS
jgi:hypothetical protein